MNVFKSVLVAAALCVAASPVLADQTWTYSGQSYTSGLVIQMFDANGRTTNGGPFTANVYTNDGSLPASLTSFRTFCLESQTANLNINGGIYAATIDQVAIDGDINSVWNPIKTRYEDKLSGATGWLYDAYLKNHTDFGANIDADGVGGTEYYTNAQLNAAFVALEESTSSPSSGTLAYNAIQRAGANSAASYRVYALNLWTLVSDGHGGYNATDIQTQLVQIPAPGAVLLGMMGFSLIGWLKRRFA